MAFGDRIKARREELALSRPQLADRLGVTPSTVSNYETGVSFPKEEMMLRLFDCLETDPNTLFQDSFRRGADVLTERERQLLEQYRSLSPLGRESVQTMVEALRACQQESAAPEQEPRVIPCTGLLRRPVMRRRCSARISTTSRSQTACLSPQSLPCVSRGTPWSPTSRTAPWSM